MDAPPTLIWLDDERDPSDSRWRNCFPINSPTVIWAKCFDDFAAWIGDNGLPDAVSFDHDLGDGPSGMDAAKHLVNYCLDHQVALPI